MKPIQEILLQNLEIILDKLDKDMEISPKTYKKFENLLKELEKDFKLFDK